MKRAKREPSSKAGRSASIDPKRLIAVRGGGSIGIDVEVAEPPRPDMQNQHNEALVRL
jgi:hypothetical protein